MADRIFDYGPVGRGFVVDDQGRLIVNAATSGDSYVYAYGDTGYPLCVDGAGRILVNVSGLVTGGTGDVTDAELLATSGALQTQIDTLLNSLDWQESVKDRNLTAPPAAVSGDRYLVATGGTGLWSGLDGKIVEYTGSAWTTITPTEGCACWVEDENIVIVHNGSAWVVFGSVITHNNLGGIQGGASADYYHLTNVQHTDLTDGGDSSLHYHQADRDAAETYTDSAISSASGILNTKIGGNTTNITSNDNDITALQAVSGDLSNYHAKNEDILPTTSGTYDLGSESKKFVEAHATSGLFEKLYVGTGIEQLAAVDDMVTLHLEKTSGGESVLRIDNAGSGSDIRTTDGNFTVDTAGTVIAPSGRFTSGLQVGSASFQLSPDGDLTIPGTSVNIANLGTSADITSASGALRTDVTALQSASGNNTLQEVLDAGKTAILGAADEIVITQPNAAYTVRLNHTGTAGRALYVDNNHSDGISIRQGTFYNSVYNSVGVQSVESQHNDGSLISAKMTHATASNDFRILKLESAANAGSMATITKTGTTTGSLLELNNAGIGEDIAANEWSIDYQGNIATAGTISSTNASDDEDNICLDLIKVSGVQPILAFVNTSNGNDITGNSGNWQITKNGEITAQDIVVSGSLTVNSLNVTGQYQTTVALVDWAWDSGESLYKEDIVHNLGKKYVIAQYYNTSNDNSVEIDHHTFIDANTLRIWSSTSGVLGVIIQ